MRRRKRTEAELRRGRVVNRRCPLCGAQDQLEPCQFPAMGISAICQLLRCVFCNGTVEVIYRPVDVTAIIEPERRMVTLPKWARKKRSRR